MKELNGLIYLERKALKQSEKKPLLVLIHGYGSNEEDLFGFASELPDEFHILSLRAPHTLSFGMYAWYGIDFVNMQKFNNIPEGLSSINQIVQFIDAFLEVHDMSEVWLCGFSQGAILSYAIALNHPDKVKNIAILSGYPEIDFIGEKIAEKDFSNLNFFISHGLEDMVIPVEWAREGKPLLDNLNIKNEYHEYRSGHGIVPQNFYDLLSWINSGLGST